MSFLEKKETNEKENGKLFGIAPDLLILKRLWVCTDLMLRNKM